MAGDLRTTTLYREVEQHVRRMLEPGFGRVTGAADVAPSPDGARIAFTGGVLQALEGTPSTRVCVADVATGHLGILTAGPHDDRQPRWSPDGTRLSFLSDRAKKGRAQLQVLRADRLGEAEPGPEVDGTVEYHAWSPDGRSVLLGVASEGAALAGIQGSGSAAAEPADVPSWMPRVERGGEPQGWRRLWLADVETGTARPASREGLNVWEAAWCGASQVAAIVSEEPDEGAWYTAPLALIDVETGKERILCRSEVQLGLPAASPSGRRLAVVEALCSDRMIVAGAALLVDPDSGETIAIDTLGVDVTYLAWRDEERLVFAGVRGQQTVAGEFDVRTEQAAELWASDDACGFVYPETPPMPGALAVALQSYERPPTIAVVREGRAVPVRTLEHDGTAYVRSIGGTMEEVAWTAPDGLEIRGLLVRPPGDGPHPLVTVVHGGPIGVTQRRWPANGMIPLLVSRGHAVLLPNPRGSTGRGAAFAAMVYGDPGGGDAGDILAGIDALVERGIADPDRLGVTGGSYGGFMTCWLVTRTDRFAAAVAVSPVTDWYSQHLVSNIGFWDREFLRDDPGRPGGAYFERSPVMFAGRVRTPTLLTAGGVDECTPPGQAIEFHRALREQGVETVLAVYPEEGHGVRRLPAVIDYLTRLVGWFESHMPAAAGDPPA